MSGDFKRTLWLYAVAVAVVVAALAFVTMQTLTLEAREHRSREEARWQEQLRTALWRMENAMSPIITREAARPYFQYRAFYPAGRAYTQMFQEIGVGDILVPSPLLCAGEPFIKLHFQRGADGTLGSPTVPAADVARETQEAIYCSPERVAEADFLLRALAGLLSSTDLSARLAESSTHRLTMSLPPAAALAGQPPRSPQPQTESWSAAQKQTRYGNDFSARSSAAIRAQSNRTPELPPAPVQQNEQALLNVDEEEFSLLNLKTLADNASAVQACATPVDQSDFASVWIDGFSAPELLMVRSVGVGNDSFVQGVWFDWSQLQSFLLGQIRDILPAATVEPIRDATSARRAALSGNPLATIAAELVTGPAPHTPLPLATPTRLTLLLAWLVTAAAAISVTRMLLASVELAERRGRFVSAVTHELRTPLTTFCMYSQMLADGVVKDEPSRMEYFATLRDQSRKLARIVEDVLAYARLARHSTKNLAPFTAPATDLRAALATLLPTLRAQAHAAGMTLETGPNTAPDTGPAISVAFPCESLERILSNLVDNAAKYAAQSSDKRIHLNVSSDSSRASIEISDHGPGIPQADRPRLFEPFERGSEHDRSAIPGLGLGLALSRILARESRGDLKLAPDTAGARFVLTLPLAPAAASPRS